MGWAAAAAEEAEQRRPRGEGEGEGERVGHLSQRISTVLLLLRGSSATMVACLLAVPRRGGMGTRFVGVGERGGEVARGVGTQCGLVVRDGTGTDPAAFHLRRLVGWERPCRRRAKWIAAMGVWPDSLRERELPRSGGSGRG